MHVLRWNVIKYATLTFALNACSDDGGGNSNIVFTAGPTPLAFAAAQVADGPWQVITPSADGSYTFAAVGQTYGIAAVCANDVYASVTVLQATTAETTSPSVDCYVFGGGEPAILNGTVTGAASQLANLTIANDSIGKTSADPWSYSIMAPAGTWDVFARRYPTVNNLDRIIRRDDVALSVSAPAVVDFDFASEGFAPEPHTVSFEGLQTGETTTVTSTMRSHTGGSSLDLGMSTAGSYLAFPVAELRADDVQIIMANAFLSGASYRQIRRTFVAADDFTATLPAMPPPTLVESETPTPYLRMRATMPSELDADRVDLVYNQQQVSIPWTASLSRGYRERGNVTTYTLPDLSALAGFDLGWGLTPGKQVTWTVVTWSSDADTGDLFEATATGERTDAVTAQGGLFPN